MFENLEILENLEIISSDFDLTNTLICTGSALLLGIIIALFYMFKHDYNKQFVITLVMLPAIVGAVIAIVNGNIGTGIAVMGAFSLVRFRSIPGAAKDICFIFFSMAVGLATGMGHIAFATVFTVVIGLMSLVLFNSRFGEHGCLKKQLTITIPENLDYVGLFDDLFAEYTLSNKLKNVKSSNMGSLFKLQYEIMLKDETKEKQFIDKLRCRNGNLDISCGHMSNRSDVL